MPSWLVIADELPDGLIVADETGQVTVFNAAAARLTQLRTSARAVGVSRITTTRLTDAGSVFHSST